MAPARRDFSRANANGGDDFSSTVITTVLAIGVIGYIISRLLRRGPAAAANAGNNNNNAAGENNNANNRNAAPAAAGRGGAANKKPSADANNANLSLEERMATLAFGGWKVAIDVDAIVSRPAGVMDMSPTLRMDGTETYLSSLLAANADAYIYCEVHRDASKKDPSMQHYVGEATTELVGQHEILSVLKPYGSQGLKREQVLFCSTPKGHEAFSRQLQPTILITTRPSVVALLAKHVPYIVLVGDNTSDVSSAKYSNVLVVDSLGRFMS